MGCKVWGDGEELEEPRGGPHVLSRCAFSGPYRAGEVDAGKEMLLCPLSEEVADKGAGAQGFRRVEELVNDQCVDLCGERDGQLHRGKIVV